MRRTNGLVAIAFALVVASGALACGEKGTLEKAGEKVDEMVDDVTHPGEGAFEEAARKTGEKFEEVKEDLGN